MIDKDIRSEHKRTEILASKGRFALAEDNGVHPLNNEIKERNSCSLIDCKISDRQPQKEKNSMFSKAMDTQKHSNLVYMHGIPSTNQ